MAQTHELKIKPTYYKEVLLGLKKVEIRFNDRDFKEGDLLILNEFDTSTGRYTGGQIKRKANYILSDIIGLEKGYVAIQIVPL